MRSASRLLAVAAPILAIGCAAAEPDAGLDVAEAALEAPLPAPEASTHSSRTPMGVHFEGLLAKVPSADERAFLSDAQREPSVPPSVSSLHFEAFPVDLYPNGAPSPADVNQHAIGDCSAASVWASLAMQAPELIQSIIADHGDGTFGVRVFDPAGRRFVIEVDSKFLARSPNALEAVSAKSGKADWATVLEKAALKYLEVYPVVGRIGGIGSELASPIFTGSGDSYAYYPGKLTPSQLTRVVREELARGKLVIGGFHEELPIGDVKTVTAHAYMIAVPATPSAMVTMRNPWGASPRTSGGYDRTRDGLIDVPATADWAATVDLRIIAPGAASGPGTTQPYAPPP